jgi:hypothetical protein
MNWTFEELKWLVFSCLFWFLFCLFQLVNREMFWVVTDVCSEQILIKRSKIIKHFIKTASKCFNNVQKYAAKGFMLHQTERL